MEEAHNIDAVKKGFEDHWNIEKLHQHYDSLKKNRDGSIKITHKGIGIHFSGMSFKEHLTSKGSNKANSKTNCLKNSRNSNGMVPIWGS